jgi:hypothetical protein
MVEAIKIQCSCGQENELVESPEGLRYNMKRHGNGELCKGKCFNCRAPLKGLEPESVEGKSPPKPAAETNRLKKQGKGKDKK